MFRERRTRTGPGIIIPADDNRDRNDTHFLFRKSTHLESLLFFLPSSLSLLLRNRLREIPSWTVDDSVVRHFRSRQKDLILPAPCHLTSTSSEAINKGTDDWFLFLSFFPSFPHSSSIIPTGSVRKNQKIPSLRSRVLLVPSRRKILRSRDTTCVRSLARSHVREKIRGVARQMDVRESRRVESELSFMVTPMSLLIFFIGRVLRAYAHPRTMRYFRA